MHYISATVLPSLKQFRFSASKMEKLIAVYVFASLLLVLILPLCPVGIRLVPTGYPGKVIRADPGTCPTEGSQDQAKLSIRNDIAEIVRQTIVPALECRLGQCQSNPALSCNQILEDNPARDSGLYWLQRLDGTAVQVFCAMDNPCGCNSTKEGWMRIAYLNMSDTDEECPHGMRLNSDPRSCSRKVAPATCVSAFYSSYFLEYGQVCGRITGYQDSSPDAFWPYFDDRTHTIDDPYVDGVSLTHGFSPRKHVWTFAGGVEDVGNSPYHCPCSSTNYQGVVPSFVGNDYFCESAELSSQWRRRIYSENPLWDGIGCVSTSTCCTLNNPPWFCKTLPQPTQDNIEVRACGDQHRNDEDVLLSLLEIYVQ